MLAAMSSCLVVGFLLSMVVVAALLMVSLLCGCGCFCFSCHAWHVPTCRTPPGEGGGSKVHWGGVSPTLGAEAKLEWKGRSAAEVCTSAARKTAGNPLRRAIGAEPLSEACLPYLCASAHLISGWALRAGTARRDSLCFFKLFLFRGVQRGYFSFTNRKAGHGWNSQIPDVFLTTAGATQCGRFCAARRHSLT